MHDFIFRRRIHVSGSIAKDVKFASPEAVRGAREFIAALVKELIRREATFHTSIALLRPHTSSHRPSGETAGHQRLVRPHKKW